MYSLTTDKVITALVSAHTRGVDVWYITWPDKTSVKRMNRLKAALGTNVKKDSYVLVCDGACRIKGGAGTQHAKAITFSKTGSNENVTVISSGNFTGGGVDQWNEFHTIVDNKPIYTAVSKYIRTSRDTNQYDFPSIDAKSYQSTSCPTKTATTTPSTLR